MDETRLTTALDTDIGVPLKPVRWIKILAGMPGRRRVWTLERKRALGSVVVPGTIGGGANDPGGEPVLYCAVIVKQVDAQTRSKTSINELLRD